MAGQSARMDGDGPGRRGGVHEPDVDAEALPQPDFAEEEGAERQRFVLRRDPQRRLDVYLHQRLKGISRSKCRQLIELGGVTVNGRLPKPSQILREGDVVDLILPPPAARDIRPEPMPLDILFEDEHFVVVNKQADLIVHPARGRLTGTLINGLAWHFQQQTGGGLSSVGEADARPGVVHRLDRHTTGVMVVAKSDAAHWQLARQFEQRTVLKAYLAVVHGCPDGPGGVIDQPIGKHPTIREAFAVRHDQHGKPSVSLYRVRERYQGYTLVEVELKTGRTHQIRVHFGYIGCPLAGDIVYGGEVIGETELADPPLPAAHRRDLPFARTRDEGVRLESEAAERPDVLLATPALHAASLSLVHPIRQQPMTFTAPVHPPLHDLIRRLRARPAPGPVASEGFHVDLASAVPD